MMWSFRKNHNAFGATEYMVDGFNEHISPYLININKINQFVCPGMFPSILEMFRSPCILWLHNTPKQYDREIMAIFTHPTFQSSVLSVVVPSNFAKSKWVEYGFSDEVITVIPNAINPMPIKKSKQITGAVKIIYVSDSSRGLEMLLRATDLVTENFQLDVFGSVRTHGIDFHNNKKSIEWLPKLKNLENITFYGYSEKRTVHKHLLESDLMVYPSIFLETFCLSMVEAMAAGVNILATPYGAIPEVCGSYPTYINYNEKLESIINNDRGTLLDQYQINFPKYFQQDISMLAEKIDDTIRKIKINPVVDIDNAKVIQEKYSWGKIKEHWLVLDKKIGAVIDTERNCG